MSNLLKISIQLFLEFRVHGINTEQTEKGTITIRIRKISAEPAEIPGFDTGRSVDQKVLEMAFNLFYLQIKGNRTGLDHLQTSYRTE